MRLHWLLLAAALPLAPAAPCAQPACACAGVPTPGQARAEATAVFRGTVVAVRDTILEEEGLSLPVRAVAFRVHREWKGALPDTVVLTTGWGGGDCGVPFEEGEEYLVYAGGAAGRLSTGLCSRTAPVARAREDLQRLGPPRPRGGA